MAPQIDDASAGAQKPQTALSSDDPVREPVRTSQGEYEFIGEQNSIIRLLSSRMRWVGIFIVAFGVVSILHGLATRAEEAVPSFIWGAVQILIGAWTVRAAHSFSLVATTEGRDITNIMNGFNTIRKLYSFQFWLLLAGIVVFILGISFTVRVGPVP